MRKQSGNAHILFLLAMLIRVAKSNWSVTVSCCNACRLCVLACGTMQCCAPSAGFVPSCYPWCSPPFTLPAQALPSGIPHCIVKSGIRSGLGRGATPTRVHSSECPCLYMSPHTSVTCLHVGTLSHTHIPRLQPRLRVAVMIEDVSKVSCLCCLEAAACG